MKKNWRKLWPICLFIGLQACGNPDRNGRDETAKMNIDSMADTTNKAQALSADVDLNGDAKIFVLNAATSGMMEVEAANLALKKSKDKSLRDFAANIIKDHGMVNEELKTIANEKGMELPKALPDKSAGNLTMFNTLEDRAFNVQYLRMMINDHEKSQQLFTEGTRLADEQLREFSIKTLPMIQNHYLKAVELGKKLNIDNKGNGDDVLGLSPTKTDKNSYP